MTYEQLKEEAQKCIEGERTNNQLLDAICSFVDDCTPVELAQFAIQITRKFDE